MNKAMKKLFNLIEDAEYKEGRTKLKNATKDSEAIWIQYDSITDEFVIYEGNDAVMKLSNMLYRSMIAELVESYLRF